MTTTTITKTTTILADGKLMYNEGIYSKPSSGTGAGTRKDENWDTAYSWGDHSEAGYLTSESDTLATVTGRGASTTTSCTFNTITMNTPVVAVAEAPFGGIKQTGYGREGGSGAIKDYLNVKYTHMGIKI